MKPREAIKKKLFSLKIIFFIFFFHWNKVQHLDYHYHNCLSKGMGLFCERCTVCQRWWKKCKSHRFHCLNTNDPYIISFIKYPNCYILSLGLQTLSYYYPSGRQLITNSDSEVFDYSIIDSNMEKR